MHERLAVLNAKSGKVSDPIKKKVRSENEILKDMEENLKLGIEGLQAHKEVHNKLFSQE